LKQWLDIFGEGYLAVVGATSRRADQDRCKDTQSYRQTILAALLRGLSHFDDCTPGVMRGIPGSFA
jgi:hypothetical protein